MTRFAFIIHPMKAKDAARKFPFLKVLGDSMIEGLIRRLKPVVAGEITGIESKTGAKTEGIFVGLPLTPRQFLELPTEEVYDKIVACAELAQREGCVLIGLGAFTSVVGDGGITVAERANIAVTTGNSYTVSTSIDGSLKACRSVGIDPASSTLAVVGATGSIGKTCATVLSEQFGSTVLIGRDESRTQQLASELPRATGSTDIDRISQADLIVTVTSSDSALIEPQHLKRGAVVCDVARPRDVSIRVNQERKDVLVIEGGVVSVPGDVKFGFDFGFPPKTAYACMSETMILALEDRAENFTLGKDVSVEQVREISALADKHGFEISGFRSFEEAVSEEAIGRVRQARMGAHVATPSYG